ncbi:MAG: 50S ribosomal protein L4 [Prevotellaceae bacterium]|jgi:large subunit ribosomal protein L4|nr:50S ribosomal protein L4 [Prevotellaceae bacterium]
MELKVLNIKGEETGRTVVLNDAVYAIEPNDHAIYLDVKQYLANQRQGTHKSKQRSEIAGSTKKLGKQKGGGGARRGDINSPLLHGGARVFGPVPRDYSFKLNKKLKQLARKSAFAAKAQENAIVVVEDFNFETPKTKDFIALANALKINDKKTLLIINENNDNIFLSARNLPKVKVVTTSELSTYKILDCAVLLIAETAVEGIDKHFKLEEK